MTHKHGSLEWFNEMWSFKMGGYKLTEKEFTEALKDHPGLPGSYYLQEQLAKKYTKI